MVNIFRLFSALLYGGKSPVAYDGRAARPPSSSGPVKPLDPIDENLVGCLNLSACAAHIRACGLLALVTAVGLLTDIEEACPEEHWVEGFKPCRRNHCRVGMRYAAHRQELESCGLLRRVPFGDSKATSGYFCVDKNETHARSIFNGKYMSRRCPAPDPVNLVDTRGLVQRIRRFIEDDKERRLYAYGGDFRHWFHQIRTPRRLQRLFGLLFDGGRGEEPAEYQWQALPMGWSWSPFVAQSMAWAVITHKEPGEADIFDLEGLRQNRLPTWLPLVNAGRQVGIATVYYDNFLILTHEEAVYKEAVRRIRRACTPELLGAVIKPKSEFEITPKIFRTKGFDYLGVHFQGCTARGGRNSLVGMRWYPTKLEQWAEKKPIVEQLAGGARIKAREAAIIIGQVIFASIMAPEGLRRYKHGLTALRAARELGRSVHLANGSWDVAVGGADTLIREIASSWVKIQELSQFPHRHLFDEPSEADEAAGYIVASDASRSGLGHAVYDRGGTEHGTSAGTHDCQARLLSANEQGEHIFLLEMRAALEGLARWDQLCPAGRAIVVVDNSAVAFALRNGFSSNGKAADLMGTRQMTRILDRVADVVLVISEDNPTDCCSRVGERKKSQPHHDYEVRLRRMMNAVNAHQAGLNVASRARGPKDWAPCFEREKMLRHPEGSPLDPEEQEDRYLALREWSGDEDWPEAA